MFFSWCLDYFYSSSNLDTHIMDFQDLFSWILIFLSQSITNSSCHIGYVKCLKKKNEAFFSPPNYLSSSWKRWSIYSEEFARQLSNHSTSLESCGDIFLIGWPWRPLKTPCGCTLSTPDGCTDVGHVTDSCAFHSYGLIYVNLDFAVRRWDEEEKNRRHEHITEDGALVLFG